MVDHVAEQEHGVLERAIGGAELYARLHCIRNETALLADIGRERDLKILEILGTWRVNQGARPKDGPPVYRDKRSDLTSANAAGAATISGRAT